MVSHFSEMPKPTGQAIFEQVETLLWIQKQDFEKRYAKLSKANRKLYEQLASAHQASSSSPPPPTVVEAPTVSSRPKPKANYTAYKVYAQRRRDHYAGKDLSKKEITETIRQKWKELSKEKKDKYKAKANQANRQLEST